MEIILSYFISYYVVSYENVQSTIKSETFYSFKWSFVPFLFLSDEHLLFETEQWSLFQTLYPWRIRPPFGLGFGFWEVRTIFPNNPFCISKEITASIKSSKYLWQTGWSPRRQPCLVKHPPFRGLLQCCSLGTKINCIFRTFSGMCSNISVFQNLSQSLFQRNIPNWLSFHFFLRQHWNASKKIPSGALLPGVCTRARALQFSYKLPRDLGTFKVSMMFFFIGVQKSN